MRRVSLLASGVTLVALLCAPPPTSGRAAVFGGGGGSTFHAASGELDGLIFRIAGAPNTHLQSGGVTGCDFNVPRITLAQNSDGLSTTRAGQPVVTAIRASSTGVTVTAPASADYVVSNGSIVWIDVQVAITGGSSSPLLLVFDPTNLSCGALEKIGSSAAGDVYFATTYARPAPSATTGCFAVGSNGTTTAVTVELGGCDPSLFPPITPIAQPPPAPPPPITGNYRTTITKPPSAAGTWTLNFKKNGTGTTTFNGQLTGHNFTFKGSTLTSPGGGANVCPTVGTYRIHLDGNHLTLTVIHDTCKIGRAQVLPGHIWTKVG
jgi:hypothetical protein